jgi:hypothetical protein
MALEIRYNGGAMHTSAQMNLRVGLDNVHRRRWQSRQTHEIKKPVRKHPHYLEGTYFYEAK